MRKMNIRQAQSKARKLWGPQASVCIRTGIGGRRGDSYGIYHISSGTYACNNGKGKVMVHGNSFHSWEHCFELAKRCYKYWELRDDGTVNTW